MTLFYEKHKSTLDSMPTMVVGPLAMVSAMDGGLTLMTCMAIGAALGTGFTALGVTADISRKKSDIFNTAAGQKISGPIWALQAQSQIEYKLKSVFKLAAKKPDSKGLEKRKNKLLGKARELDKHICVVGNDNIPNNDPVLYVVEKENTLGQPERKTLIRSDGSQWANKKPNGRGFAL